MHMGVHGCTGTGVHVYIDVQGCTFVQVYSMVAVVILETLDLNGRLNPSLYEFLTSLLKMCHALGAAKPSVT